MLVLIWENRGNLDVWPTTGGVPSEKNQNLMGWSHEGLDDGDNIIMI